MKFESNPHMTVMIFHTANFAYTNCFQLNTDFPFQVSVFSTKSPSVIYRLVFQENAFKKHEPVSLSSFTLNENKFRPLR